MNFWQKYKLKRLKKRAQILMKKRESGEIVNAQIEIKAQLDLARFYDARRCDKNIPHATQIAQEYYRNAALMGSAEAQYIFAKRKLEEGRFWHEWAKSEHGQALHENYARNAFDEAFDYLREAEKIGYPLAKRLHGLCYIHGWGVAAEKERGFKLIVASIDEENAWDRATQIFQELGLNNPEFFSSIMALRGKGG